MEDSELIGRVLAEKYRVERVLGRGGMSVVVVAQHTELNHRVALKFMRAGQLANKEALGRFFREARAAAQLTSPYIARIFDVGRLEDDQPYIVMEHLVGEDMGMMLQREKAVSERAAADYVLQACLGLAEAHSKGIIHRDIKPGNLFVVRRDNARPMVKLLDFGIAKATQPTFDDGVQTLATVMGTPAYSSPEQLLSPDKVDARSDIYSLGVVLYRLVAGRRPFVGTSYAELSAQALRDPPAPLKGLRRPLQPAFIELVSKCLSKTPDERFQTARELAHALIPFASGDSAPRGTLSSLPRHELSSPDLVSTRLSIRDTATTLKKTQGKEPGVDVFAPTVEQTEFKTATSATVREFAADRAARRGRARLVTGLMVAGIAAFVIVTMVRSYSEKHARLETPSGSSSVQAALPSLSTASSTAATPQSSDAVAMTASTTSHAVVPAASIEKPQLEPSVKDETRLRAKPLSRTRPAPRVVTIPASGSKSTRPPASDPFTYR